MTPPITADINQFKASLNSYASWTYETAKPFNKRIIKHIESIDPKISTPQKVLGPFQKHRLALPIPIREERSRADFNVFTTRIKGAVDIKTRHRFITVQDKLQFDSTTICALVRLRPTTFTSTSCDSLFINGMQRCLRQGDALKEGDIICTQTEGKTLLYWFTVGQNGLVTPYDSMFPKPLFSRSPEAIKQTEEVLRKQHFLKDNPADVELTSHPLAVEFSEPFTNGFIFFPFLYTWNDPERLKLGILKSLKEDGQIVVDLEKDKLLSSVINYLEKEFEIMKYTDTQKLFRLYQFILSSIESCDLCNFNALKKHYYYLGEFLRFGMGECSHFALLFKVMADQLKLSNAMILAQIPTSSETHAWNIAFIDGKRYLIDINFNHLFLMDEPPNKEWAAYYGLRSSA